MKYSRLLIAAFGLPLCMPATGLRDASLLTRLPLRFEASATGFIARGTRYSVTLDRTGSAITIGKTSVRMHLLGASTVRMEPVEPIAGTTNYFIGDDPRAWKTSVPGYGRVLYRSPFPGIDLAYYGHEGSLEYDFIVSPGANPSKIEFEVLGAKRAWMTDEGDLALQTEAGELRWKKPNIYQGEKKVPGRFIARGKNRFGFELGEYDPSRSVVIDPALIYSTYIGGSQNEAARAVAVDSAGNAYIAGITTSSNLPVTASAYQPTYAGGTSNVLTGDVFVAKFSTTGSLVYLTYLGGAGDDFATSIAVDAGGNAYITGGTNSRNFPITTSAIQTTFAGYGDSDLLAAGDAFVAKLSPTGNQLLYSTYFGGRGDDLGQAISLDSAGNIYVAGSTISTNFPTTAGAYQTSLKGTGGESILPCCNTYPYAPGDAFVFKLNPSGSQILYSTMLGGSEDDSPTALAIDAAGNAYVAGYTLSTDFPVTPNAPQQTFGGTDPQTPYFHRGDAFITKLNPAGAALVWSTYLGGAGDEWITGIALDSANNVYVAGATSTQSGFPTTSGAFQTRYGGYYTLPFNIEILYGDAFVAKLNSNGSSLAYCTYLGGSDNDSAMAIAVDSAGNAYVTGFTDSPDFPVTSNAIQPKFGGDGIQWPYLQYGDAFLTVVNPAGTGLIYSSFLGGSADDMGLGLALDSNLSVHIVGNTVSSNYPVTQGALQASFGGYADVFYFLRGDALYSKVSGFASIPTVANVLNGASFASGAFAPGSLITIFGSFPGASTASASGLPLPDALGGVSVTINGASAPLNFVNATQINTQVPWDAVSGPATAVVTSGGVASSSFPFTIGPASPGIFTYGANLAVAQNHDYTLNTTSDPAAVGSFVIVYMTGGGAVNATIATGAASPSKPVASVTAPASATIGGQPADVLFLGMAPGFVGIVQADIKIPSLAPGAYPVVVTIGGVQSNGPLISVSGK